MKFKFSPEKIILILILLLAGLIRLWQLDSYPAGLNADEAAIGYNAYSLLQTGHDEHGASWPLVFRSFDDYKPPLYFYMVLPFVATLGLNVISVRLPSALLGILAIYLIYLLSNRLFPDKNIEFGKRKISLGLIAALILALSPWHIHFSRGGWEVNAATTLVLAGFVFLWGKPRRYLVAALALVASLYTYHALRVILPFLLLVYFWLEHRPLLKVSERRRWIPALVLAAVLLLPLAFQFLSVEGRARFTGVSVFADQGPLWEALALRAEHGGNSIPNRILHNRYLSYGLRFGQNYLSHFSPRFLFIEGDEIGRSRIPETGQALLVSLPFFVLGFIVTLTRKRRPETIFIVTWLLMAPLAAALTFQSPHALRAQNMTIPLSIISALGVWAMLKAIKPVPAKWIAIALLLLMTTYESGRVLHQYFLHYPRELPIAWEYGFEQLAEYIKTNGEQYDRVIISDRYDQPYIIMAFFLKYPPAQFQNEIELEARDKFGFSTVRSFGKFEFRPVNYHEDSLGNTLIVAIDEGAPVEAIETINFPNGKPAFRLYQGIKVQ